MRFLHCCSVTDLHLRASAWGSMYAVGYLSVTTTKDKRKNVSIYEQPSSELLLSVTEPSITPVLDSTRYFILDVPSDSPSKISFLTLRETVLVTSIMSGKLPRVGIAFENRTTSTEFLAAVGITPKPYEPPVDPAQKQKDQLKRIMEAAGVTEEDLKVSRRLFLSCILFVQPRTPQ